MEGVCIRCMSEDPYIDKLCACLKYNPYSAKLIMKLKNFADTKVMDFFMPMIKNELINLSIDYIVPIPLHWLRWLWRGYDQAAVIANEIANHIHKPYLPFALKRIRFTQPNVKSRKERAKKIHRAFKVTIKFNGENILLIDDVHTTGATMKECAKILKKAGAGKVIGLVLCKN